MSNQNQKISHIFNLPNFNFKTQMNIAVDSNAHIKNIINVQCYMFDTNLDAVTGKCNVKGKIGVKILYLDVDNVYNTITDETSFSEFVSAPDLTSDCKISMYNEQISNDITFDEKFLKLNLNVNAKLYGNIDIALNLPETNYEGLVCKCERVEANTCVERLDNKASDDCVITLPNRASKILSVNITPSVENIDCNSGYLTISGTSLIQTIYEIDKENNNQVKLHNELCSFKFETQATLAEANCNANVCVKVNNSKTVFTTELDENQTTIKLDYEFQINGFVYKTIELELTQDLYCTLNEIETNFATRELSTMSSLISYKANIDGEIQLLDTSADEILETANFSCLITQSYIENNKLVLEGVIGGTVIYLTEQREVKSMLAELPFSIAKEFEGYENSEALNFEIKPIACRAKIKRGSSLSLDFETNISGFCIKKYQTKMLETIKFGKNLDYGEIAFQIMLAKPNENIWDFCKRAHVTLQKLEEANKEIPTVFNGGEKVIIYR